MLKELLEQGFGLEEGYNCAERIIYGANQAYGMGLSKESLKLFAGMGGGMAVGEMCGAVTASIGVLSHFFVRDRAHEPEGKIKPLSVEFVKRFVERMDCYRCDCSRERTEQMLLSLGRKELEKLRDEDPHCEVVCHFCHTKYQFDLNKLVKKAVDKQSAPAEETE